MISATMPMTKVRNTLPLVIGSTSGKMYIAPASEAIGRNWLPGSTTDRNRMNGTTITEHTMLVASPTTRDGLRPMRNSTLPLNLRCSSFLTASVIGSSPSPNRPEMRGIRSITAPMLTASFRIAVTS